MSETVLEDSEMAQGEGGGRPRVELTDEQKIQVEALAGYLNQDQIADYLGISRQTLHAIMKRDPEVSLRYQRGKATIHQDIAKSLIQTAREGNVTAQIFYLKTQCRWSEAAPEQKELPPLTINVIDATPE